MKNHVLTFARCACPAIHWAVRGSFIGCAECRGREHAGTFATMMVVTPNPRKVKAEINKAKSMEEIRAIIDRENAKLPKVVA